MVLLAVAGRSSRQRRSFGSVRTRLSARRSGNGVGERKVGVSDAPVERVLVPVALLLGAYTLECVRTPQRLESRGGRPSRTRGDSSVRLPRFRDRPWLRRRRFHARSADPAFGLEPPDPTALSGDCTPAAFAPSMRDRGRTDVFRSVHAPFRAPHAGTSTFRPGESARDAATATRRRGSVRGSRQR